MIEQLPKKSASNLRGVIGNVAGNGAEASKKSPALQSVAHLQQIERQAGSDDDLGAKLKKGVVAALLGLTLIGASVTPAHADTVQQQLPQTAAHSLSLDSAQLNQARGPDYARLLGSVGSSWMTTTTAPATTPTTTPATTTTVDAATQQAFATFETKLTRILQRDAGSLAQGLRPLQTGDTPSAAQQKELQRAVSDLFANLPLGAFAPGVQNTIEAALGVVGGVGGQTNQGDLSTTRMKDLGKVGGDAAQNLVKQFQKDHPKAFWSLAGTGAAAALAVGYTQGTDALEKLGIKPELKTTLFDDVKLKVGLRAGKHFSDPRATIGLDGQHTFAGGSTLRGGVSAELHGKQLSSVTVNGAFSSSSGGNVDGKISFDGHGKPFDARLSASQTFAINSDVLGAGQGVVFANAAWSNGHNGTPVQSTLSAGVLAQHGRWTTSMTANHDFNSGAFSASLATGRTYDVVRKNDLDLQVRATIDNQGKSSVGVGVTLHF